MELQLSLSLPIIYLITSVCKTFTHTWVIAGTHIHIKAVYGNQHLSAVKANCPGSCPGPLIVSQAPGREPDKGRLWRWPNKRMNEVRLKWADCIGSEKIAVNLQMIFELKSKLLLRIFLIWVSSCCLSPLPRSLFSFPLSSTPHLLQHTDSLFLCHHFIPTFYDLRGWRKQVQYQHFSLSALIHMGTSLAFMKFHIICISVLVTHTAGINAQVHTPTQASLFSPLLKPTVTKGRSVPL